MIVPANIKKCVVFIGFKLADGSMRFAGSGFFLGTELTNDSFLVTARHVIDGIRSKGLDEIYFRANTVSGQSEWLLIQSKDWLFHPTDSSVDVALVQMGVPPNLDHLIIPTTKCATDEVLQTNAVDVGEEVFVVGLFKHHHGTNRNIPIIRVGNLAALSEEKVATKKFGSIDAHLIEARSIGGLSGSPVFLNLGVVRILDGQLRQAQGGPMYFLFGLIHGHYDVNASGIDYEQDDASKSVSIDQINTGIAIVVPIHKILETMAAYSTS